MFLFVPEVLAFARHLHSQAVAVETQARVGVAHHNRRMVYAQEELVRSRVPLGQTLVRGELQYLEVVPVRVLEIECFDSCRVLVPGGQRLGPRRGVSYLL